MTVALIDADIFSRRYTAAVEYELFTVDGPKGATEVRGKKNTATYMEENPGSQVVDSRKVVEPLGFVKHNIKAVIEDIAQDTKCDEMLFFLGEQGVPTFRHKLYSEYKHKRVNTPRPTHYQAIYDWLKEEYHATSTHELEADDVIAIHSGMPNDPIICSNDKDMLQLPGKHYNFVNADLSQRRRRVGKHEGDVHLFIQVLMGDSVDCIPGLKGVGFAKAQKIVAGCKDFRSLYEAARLAYKTRLGNDWKESFLLNGSLVFLLRSGGDTFEAYLERNGVKFYE